MRQIRITDLPQASALTGNELTIVVQNGVSKKTSINEIVNNASSEAKHWADVAQDAAALSLSSAGQASTSASQADSYKNSAQSSSISAGVYATSAGNSATSAASSANQASSYAQSAQISATNASNSAISAASSASAANSAKLAAQAAESATLGLFEDFDTRYLGAKTADPTVNNQGGPLIIGALYWNIPDGVMKAWSGLIWTAVSSTPGYYLVASNNLSDLTDAALARDNLGVPSKLGYGASGTWSIDISGNAATVTNGLYSTGSYSNPSWLTELATSKLTGTVSNAQLSNSTITINGYSTSLGGSVSLTYSDVGAPSTIGSGATGTWGINITGNSATVTNGLYSTGSYADPTWLTSLATSKLSGTVSNTQLANSSITINGNSVSLGGSTTVTAVNPFALTIGSGLTGTSYNGSAAVTITNSAPDQIVTLTSGTGISAAGTYPNFTITNTAPDRTVALTGGGTTTITGTYPNFTISSNDQYVGTVTSVSTGTGLTGGPITTSGTISFSNTAVGTWAATPSSANLAAAITDETGSGSLVFSNGPNLSAVNIDGANPYAQFSDGTAVTLAAGRMWYNGTTGSWNLGMGGGNITQQVGEELFRYGKASAAISDTNLQLVYKTGVVGGSGVITFAPAVAGITDPDQIIGVATEPIAPNGFGRVTTYGVVHGLDTTGSVYGETWVDNDDIWYNPVTGGLTKTKPSAPNIKFQVGTVIKAGTGGSGSFIVKFGSSSTLGGTDSNVQFGALANANIIQYSSALGYWTNTTIGSASGIQPYDADLVAIAALTPALNKSIVGDGATWGAKETKLPVLLNDGATTVQVPFSYT